VTDTALDRIHGTPGVSGLYQALLTQLDTLGTYRVEPKRTSLHVLNRTAFLGVHPRASGLLLNIVTDAPLHSARVRKSEQVSPKRCHNEVLLTSTEDLDPELSAWLGQAYSRSS
jgi:hypothetical protein